MRKLNSRLTRRRAIIASAGLAFGVLPSRFARGAEAKSGRPQKKRLETKSGTPTTGIIPPPLIGIEQIVLEVMKECEIPGAALAVSKNGRVVAYRGYGHVDADQTVVTQPSTLMRIASVEKEVTATAIDLLIRGGSRLKRTKIPVTRELRFFEALQEEWKMQAPPDKKPDPRIFSVTIEHLMRHKSGIAELGGGWDTAKDLGLDRAPTAGDMTRWVFGQPLISDPGAVSRYSNTGYGLLKFLVHWLTGDYFRFVRKNILGASGVDEYVLSRSRPEDRDPRESIYWAKETGQSLLSGDNRKVVPLPDGAMNIENEMHPAASARALAAYLSIWYMGMAVPLINPLTDKLTVESDNGGYIFGGSMAGSESIMVQRRFSLSSYAVIFNKQKKKPDGTPSGIDIVDFIAKNVLEPLQW